MADWRIPQKYLDQSERIAQLERELAEESACSKEANDLLYEIEQALDDVDYRGSYVDGIEYLQAENAAKSAIVARMAGALYAIGCSRTSSEIITAAVAAEYQSIALMALTGCQMNNARKAMADAIEKGSQC